jgi:hypothetical protein
LELVSYNKKVPMKKRFLLAFLLLSTTSLNAQDLFTHRSGIYPPNNYDRESLLGEAILDLAFSLAMTYTTCKPEERPVHSGVDKSHLFPVPFQSSPIRNEAIWLFPVFLHFSFSWDYQGLLPGYNQDGRPGLRLPPLNKTAPKGISFRFF